MGTLALVRRVSVADTPITSFQLTSATVTGTLPFSVGIAFKKGDVPDYIATTATTWQAVVKRRWNDNSVKHAVVSGTSIQTSGAPTTVVVSNTTTAPSGTNLVAGNIAAAAPSASVQCGAIGTVNLGDVLASPFRTWISGPQMVECHYRSAVGADATLVVWFQVRLWANGRIWIRAIVESGYLDVTTVDKSYVPTVIIGGVTVYNNSGSALSHYAHMRWTAEGWVGTDPQITVAHDTTYLISTKLVPNYWKFNPDASVLNALYQTYAPNESGDHDPEMGSPGFMKQVGLLPNWDALYINSFGDARAYRSVIANAKALSSFGTVYLDSNTGVTVKPSDRPTWTISGPGGGGGNAVGTSLPLTWDLGHQPSTGYLAYLITGDYYYLQTMEDTAALCYLLITSANGDGTARLANSSVLRAIAWSQRAWGLLAAIGPTGDSIVAEYRTLLSSNIDYWITQIQLSGQNLLGFLYTYEFYDEAGLRGFAKFHHEYWTAGTGFMSDIEPLSDMTNYNILRDHLYKVPVGLTGGSGTSNYCNAWAGQYVVVVTDTVQSSGPFDSRTWYDSWGTVFEQGLGFANTSCSTALQEYSSFGNDPRNAAQDFWAYFLPSIAYAVDHGAPGAADGWARLTSATNWSVLEASPDSSPAGWNNTPVWGIIPR